MRIRTGFVTVVDVLGAVIFSIITIVSFVQIIYRYVFHGSFAFAGELAVQLMIWIAFLGAAKCVAENAHTRLTVLVDKLSPKYRGAMLLLTNLLSIGFLMVAAWYGFGLVQTTWRGTTIGTGVPEGLIYLAMPAASVIMIVFFITNSLDVLRGFNEKAGEEK